MFKTLRIIHTNKYLAQSFVRYSSHNASINSKKIGLVGMGNVGKNIKAGKSNSLLQKNQIINDKILFSFV